MAACITVQLGQCGTQVGHQFFTALNDDAVKSCPIASASSIVEYKEVSLQTFFNETSLGKREARSIMVDMEPKAVAWAMQNASAKDWSYAKGQQFCSRSGSGNNWSFGYKVHAPRCKAAVQEIVRKETEKCDYFSGFLVLSSLAGGTGSGLGSYVTEMLRDLYPRASQVSALVCPYADGEVAVQNYNAVLSLAHTCTSTDASILLHNDHLHSICNKLLGIKNVSFRDLNNVIANQLASLLQPVTSTNFSSSCKSFNVLNSLLSSVACHSHYSMLDLKSLPHIPQTSVAFSTFTWNALLKRIYQMMITDFYMDEGLDWHKKLPAKDSLLTSHPKYVSNLLVMRGHEALSFDNSFTEFEDSRLYPRWIPKHNRCPLWRTNMPYQKFEKSFTLLSNGTSCIKPLDNVVSKAWNMFGSRAYFHQYTKHGLEEEDFINAFVAVENVISGYKQL